MKNTFSLVILALSLLACNVPSEVYQAKIATVDSLIVIVNEYQTRYNLIDSTSIKEQIGGIEAIAKTLRGPKVSQADKKYWTKTLAPLDLVITPYQKYLRDKTKIEKQLAYSQSQLLSLRKSLKDEVIDTVAANKYLIDEQMAVGELYMLKIKRIEPVITGQSIWDTTALKFQAMADSVDALPLNQ